MCVSFRPSFPFVVRLFSLPRPQDPSKAKGQKISSLKTHSSIASADNLKARGLTKSAVCPGHRLMLEGSMVFAAAIRLRTNWSLGDREARRRKKSRGEKKEVKTVRRKCWRDFDAAI